MRLIVAEDHPFIHPILAAYNQSKENSSYDESTHAQNNHAYMLKPTTKAINDCNYTVITTTRTGKGALEIARELTPDCIVIDASLPDTTAMFHEAVKQPVCAIVLVRTLPVSSSTTDAANVAKATDIANVTNDQSLSLQNSLLELARNGATICSSSTLTKQDLIYAIESACCCFKRECKLYERIQQLEERVETLRLADRAKSLLMQQGLAEKEAFSLLQKTSMNTRRPLKEVAEAIILTQSAQ